MENNPTKVANITYDQHYIWVNDQNFHQSILDADTENSYIQLLNGDEESVYDAEKILIWSLITKYLIQQEFTHVNDSEHDGITEIDRYLADVKIYIEELL